MSPKSAVLVEQVAQMAFTSDCGGSGITSVLPLGQRDTSNGRLSQSAPGSNLVREPLEVIRTHWLVSPDRKLPNNVPRGTSVLHPRPPGPPTRNPLSFLENPVGALRDSGDADICQPLSGGKTPLRHVPPRLDECAFSTILI